MTGIGCAWAMGALALCGIMATAGWAEVSTTGDTYDNGRFFYIGYSANSSGTLAIDSGSVFDGEDGYLGFDTGSTGTAIVTGTGSKWTNSGELYVGYSGSGTLRVEAGGQVSNRWGLLGYLSGSAGTAVISGAGSKWTNSGSLEVGYNGSGTLRVSNGGVVSTSLLLGSLSDFYGNGTITVQSGVVLDSDLSFDAAHGLTQVLAFGSGGTLQFTVDGTRELGIGYKNSGSLRIAEGRSVASTDGILGYLSGSTGTATVSGAGSTWTNSDNLYVGYHGSGTLRVEAGGQISNTSGRLGYESGSTGTAIITGAGSKWTNSYDLHVGSKARGTLRVEAGGQVNSREGYLGAESGSTGEAIITGAGSTWINSGGLYVGVGQNGRGTLTVSDGGLVSAKALYASLSDLYGNGAITVLSGGILDADLSFDKAHGLTQMLAFGSGGTLQFTVDGTSILGIGYKHAGSLRIAEGCSVVSAHGDLGLNSGSAGTATITGIGSKWTNSGGLSVGIYGSGTVRIERGGGVSSLLGTLGYNSGSTGAAIITGAGSKWTNSDNLYVGNSGSGTLTVSDRGQVTAKSLSINSRSTVRLHVSGDRMLVLGNASTLGSISNSGKLSLLADAFLPGGTYRPIGEYADRTMNSWGGSTLAVGGTWNSSAKTFTVVAPALVDAGTPVQVAGGMRLLISDLGSGERAGVSFGALNTGTAMAAPTMLRGMPLTQDERAGLLAMLGAEERVLSGWDFVGQLAGGEALVSFDVGVGAEEVRVWRRAQSGWSEYTAEMMTYDSKGIVSFTVDPGSLNGGGYAVSGVVPEPMGLGMLMVAAGMGLVRRRAMIFGHG